ncbi:tRNA 2-selenouridine(34) synthase MnmH [bacterium]|nr:tRNA 2-selenouridine(34) synthase MnmH [bacterium]
MRKNARRLISAQETCEYLRRGEWLLDVRSPSESRRYHLPNTTSIGILSDSERAYIGTLYKRHGPSVARQAGHWLVQGKTREDLCQRWRYAIRRNSISGLFCARGGLRSQLAQEWLSETGNTLWRVDGGYKALRTHLLSLLQRLPSELPFLVVTGKTGAGKTIFLQRVAQELASQYDVIDLEQCAAHRGSAFGRESIPQPSQASFENLLALQLLQIKSSTGDTQPTRPLLIEDESRTIGELLLPESFYLRLRSATRIELTRPISERVDILLEQYVDQRLAQLQDLSFSCDPFENQKEIPLLRLRRALLTNLGKIRKKLGGVRYDSVRRVLEQAFSLQRRDGSTHHHRRWIELLLLWYYDPLYEKHLHRMRPLIRRTFHPEQFFEQSSLKPVKRSTQAVIKEQNYPSASRVLRRTSGSSPEGAALTTP